MRIPDFFIVGAPKCGTSAIYSYLRTHPNVFMPIKKEPHYFARDLNLRTRYNEDAYLALFSDVPPEVTIGEASTSYLISKVAIEEIMQQNPKARMIAMLRNPIDMAYALHMENYCWLREDVADFEKAWDLQEERRVGRYIPEYCDEPIALQYQELCSYCSQIKRLFDSVPPAQRLVCIFEEFRESPRETYAMILEFLGLPDDGRSHFPQKNASRVFRSRRLAVWQRLARKRMGRWYGSMMTAAKAVGVRRIFPRSNFKKQPRAPLNEEFRRQLANELAPDVRELELLLGGSLECWKDFSRQSVEALEGYRQCTRCGAAAWSRPEISEASCRDSP